MAQSESHTWLWIGGAGIVGYLLYRWYENSQAQQAVATAPVARPSAAGTVSPELIPTSARILNIPQGAVPRIFTNVAPTVASPSAVSLRPFAPPSGVGQPMPIGEGNYYISLDGTGQDVATQMAQFYGGSFVVSRIVGPPWDPNVAAEVGVPPYPQGTPNANAKFVVITRLA